METMVAERHHFVRMDSQPQAVPLQCSHAASIALSACLWLHVAGLCPRPAKDDASDTEHPKIELDRTAPAIEATHRPTACETQFRRLPLRPQTSPAQDIVRSSQWPKRGPPR